MTHTGDIFSDILPQAQKSVMPRVAYTYGDTQPVRSTFIAHDPFFFGETEKEDLDAELLHELDQHLNGAEQLDAEFEAFLRDFQEELKSGKSKTRKSETPSDYMIDPENYMEIMTGFDEMSAFQTPERADIDEIAETLRGSRFAASLMDDLAIRNIEIEASAVITGAAYFEKERMILVNPTGTRAQIQASLLKAVRQAWQMHNGAGVNPLSLYPDHAVLINRAQQADMAVSVLRCAWEMDLNGDEGLWNYLVSDVMSDMARPFSREAATDFRTLNDGRALFTAFESWFLSDRARAFDRDLIQNMLGDYKGHKFDSEEMSQLIVLDILRALGEVPYGKNYLGAEMAALIADPIFSEVRERSTSNFLWFVKFESSFREMEQSLQEENSAATLADGNSSTSSHSGDFHDRHHRTSQETGYIINFPRSPGNQGGGAKRSSSHENDESGQLSSPAANGEVIPFDIVNRPFNTKFS